MFEDAPPRRDRQAFAASPAFPTTARRPARRWTWCAASGGARASAPPRRRSTSFIASTRTPRACSASPRRASPSAGCTTIFQRHTAARAYLAVAEGDVERDAHRIGHRRRSRRRHPRLHAPHRSGTARRHVTWSRCAGLKQRNALPRPARNRPHPPDPRSTCPNAATRSSAKRSTFATCSAPAARPSPAAALMLHAALLGFRHPVTNVALEWNAARRPPISSPCSNRWEARRDDL